jgi:hypothetical protein
MNGRRRILVLGLTAAAVLLAALAAVRCAAWLHADEEAKAEKNPKREVKEIPPEQIYALAGQQRLKYVLASKQIDEDGVEILKDLLGYRTGASNVFLVRADNIEGALSATHHAFFSGHSVDRPVASHSKSRSKSYWLAVFLGHYHPPLRWTVERAELHQDTIRLLYTSTRELKDLEEAIEEATYISLPCFYWIPVGTLEQKFYKLELHNTAVDRDVLSRHVLVE